jgi:hypothetical protein
MNEEEEKDDGLGYDKDTPMVPMFKMFVFSDVKIVLCLIFGVMSSMLAGIAMPLFIIFIGDLYNSFDPETTEKETFGELLDCFIYP